MSYGRRHDNLAAARRVHRRLHQPARGAERAAAARGHQAGTARRCCWSAGGHRPVTPGGSDAALAREAHPSSPSTRAGPGLSDKPDYGLRLRHAGGRRSGRADGRARARPVRRGRPRHRHVDRLRPRCRSHPSVVGRLAVVEAVIPGLVPSPPVFSPAAVNQKLWQFGFKPAHRPQRGTGPRGGSGSSSAGSSPPRPPPR